MSTKEPIEREIADYDFAVRLKRNGDEPFNGAELSESVLACDWNSTEEDAVWANL